VSAASPLGAILAGGRNTRYGDLKAFASVAGRPIIARAADALHRAVSDLILIANDAEAYATLGFPVRGDRITGLGAVGGLHAALHWAAEENRPGVLAIACDMPFVSTALLRRLLELARDRNTADLVAPESDNRRGLEPLCTYYSTRCLPAIERALARADSRMIGFHDEVTVVRLPLAEVRQFGDPAVLFLNVNTPLERARAEQLAQELDA
jgi:molybdopterin-guanine dinucleotide biosynthesis protein A